MKIKELIMWLFATTAIYLIVGTMLFSPVHSKTKWYNKQYDEYMQKARQYAKISSKQKLAIFAEAFAVQSIAYSNLAREIRESENK